MIAVLSYRPDSARFRASWADGASGLRVATVDGRNIYVPEDLIAVRHKAWFRRLVWRLIDTYERAGP